jgi:hypothetical protein
VVCNRSRKPGRRQRRGFDSFIFRQPPVAQTHWPRIATEIAKFDVVCATITAWRNRPHAGLGAGDIPAAVSSAW